MAGINYLMADIYGTGISTTEFSKPDANDQKALVNEDKTDNLEKTPVVDVNTSSRKKIILSVVVILIAIVVLGGKR